MTRDYWRRLRTTRRQALGGGLAVAGGLVIAACGGSNNPPGSSGTNNNAGNLTKPADTTAQAKRGGVMKDRAFADPPSLDLLTASNPLNPPGTSVYSNLVRFEPGVLKPSDNKIVPDVAE